ncbi:MAG: hypothetical protein ACQEVA_04370 [Myxococcota bacterium]
MPAAAPVCPEIILCDASGVEPGVDPRTGEYACSKPGYGVAIGADIRAAGGELIESDALYASCIADLDRLAGGVDDTSDIESLLAPGDCLNASRFLFALSSAADGSRTANPDYPGEAFSVTTRSQKHAHRLLQRWLLLHGFLAVEMTQRDQLEHILRGDGSTAPTPAEALATSLRGWDLLMHPRYATVLDELPGEVLLRPDWRVELDPQLSASAEHDHHVGIPVAMLETLAHQYALAAVHLERAAYTFDRSASDDVDALQRIAEAMRAEAVGLYSRARVAAQDEGLAEVPWAGRFEQALNRLDVARDRMLERADELRNGEPPMPISDVDLPLYFFGDAAAPGERFAAVSDYLLGRVGTSDSGWAEQAINAAEASFQTARAKWTALREREWRADISQAAQDQRIDDVRQRYGDQINELCFLPLDAYDVLNLDELSAETCFIDQQSPECAVGVRDFASRATADDIALQACSVHELTRLGHGSVRFTDDELTSIANRYEDCAAIGYDPACADFGEAGCVECVLPDEDNIRAPVTPATMRVMLPDQVGQRDHYRVHKTCSAKHPRGRTVIPGARDLENADCLRGSMGESALTILSVSKDVEIARAEYDEHIEDYDIAMRSCARQQAAADNISSAIESHNSTMEELRAGKLAADTTALVAGSIKDCMSNMSSAAGDGAISFGTSVAFAGAACGAGFVEAAAGVTSAGLQLRMDNVQASHEATVAGFERSADIDRCRIEAEHELVGLRGASLRIAQAMDELSLAMYQLDEQKNLVAALFAEGKTSLARAEARATTPPEGQMWLDEDVDAFTRQMRLARRLAYLTVRAVEYEFQQSLTARFDVLRALRPAELLAVIDDLRSQAATRGINGSRPSELKVVLSMRDHLMQIYDRTSAPDGEHRLTEVERFRSLLLSDRFKSYDDAGEFIGLRIPFELSPLDALGLGDSAGIGIFAQTDCAERLWSANASVVGSDDVLRGGSSFTRMDLLKRNTFYSQWCSEPPEGSAEFQIASVRPSVNLFRDPQYGTDFGDSRLGVVNGVDLFSRARMQPAVNVARDAFEDDAYANGQTSELAARGLYGDYALFIPANMFSRIEDGLSTDGLDVNQVDDILIRLDYLSVAR